MVHDPNRDALQIATRNGYFPILKRLYKAHGGRQGGGLQQVMSTRSIENGLYLLAVCAIREKCVPFCCCATVGDSLVHIAARYGHLEILRWFKDIGFPFNVVRTLNVILVFVYSSSENRMYPCVYKVNHKGRTPVHAAAERAQLAIIQYLYNVHGQNLNFAG